MNSLTAVITRKFHAIRQSWEPTASDSLKLILSATKCSTACWQQWTRVFIPTLLLICASVKLTYFTLLTYLLTCSEECSDIEDECLKDSCRRTIPGVVVRIPQDTCGRPGDQSSRCQFNDCKPISRRGGQLGHIYVCV